MDPGVFCIICLAVIVLIYFYRKNNLDVDDYVNEDECEYISDYVKLSLWDMFGIVALSGCYVSVAVSSIVESQELAYTIIGITIGFTVGIGVFLGFGWFDIDWNHHRDKHPAPSKCANTVRVYGCMILSLAIATLLIILSTYGTEEEPEEDIEEPKKEEVIVHDSSNCIYCKRYPTGYWPGYHL